MLTVLAIFFFNIKMSKGELPDDVVVLPSSHQMNEKKKLPDKKSILHESRRLRRNGVLSDWSAFSIPSCCHRKISNMNFIRREIVAAFRRSNGLPSSLISNTTGIHYKVSIIYYDKKRSMTSLINQTGFKNSLTPVSDRKYLGRRSRASEKRIFKWMKIKTWRANIVTAVKVQQYKIPTSRVIPHTI